MFYNSVDNTRWYYFKQIFNKEIKLPETKILFLGDSRVNTNIDFKKIPKSWSFAAGGSSPIEMYYALKNYLRVYSKPDTIFISFSPRTLVETYSFWGYCIRNNYLNYNEIKEILRINQKYPDDRVLGYFPFLKYLTYRTNFIHYYQPDLLKNHVAMAKKKNEAIIRHFQSENGAWIYPNLKDFSSELNYETGLTKFRVSPLLNHYLFEILELCKKENIFVIFEFMPMNKSSFNNLKPGLKEGYQSYIRQLSKKYPSYEIIDTMYFYSDSLFGDASHLNSKGKAIFTNYILKNRIETTGNQNLIKEFP